MGNVIKSLSIVMIFSIGIVYSQTADLVLQDNVTQAYEDSLWMQEEECNVILENPAADSLTMRAYAKRAIIHMALIHVDGNNFSDSLESVLDDIETDNERFESFWQDNIETINFDHIDSMLIDFKELFLDPRYTDLKDELEDIQDHFSEDIDSLATLSDDYFSANIDHLEIILDDLRAIKDTSVAFNFRVQIIGAKNEDVMLLTENDFYDMDSVIQYTTDGIDFFSEAGEKLDSLQNDQINSEEVIETFRNSISSFDQAMDQLEHILTTEPLSILETDTSFIGEIKDFLADVDTIFAGKEYDLENEEKTIRPVALIENPFSDFGDFLIDFYTVDDRYTYTFGNLFPHGLPPDVVDQLKENMILNSNDDNDQTEARMKQLKNDYLDSLVVNPDNSAAHLGVAITQTYLFMQDLNQELSDFAGYLDSADFRTDFDWTYFKNSALADSICDHFEQAKADDELVFTILTINNAESAVYNINQDSDFAPTYIFHGQLEIIEGTVKSIEKARDEIANVIEDIYADLDSMFVLDLDPNVLDFSEVESELDFIDILELSNPDFLDITPYGVQQFTDAREELRSAFSDYAATTGHFREFINTMTLHEEDLDIDGEELRNFAADLDDFVNEVNTDFQVPDSTTYFDERVNLSAWFDNPPNDLLLRLRWYFDDDENTDNTLGGLFPDKGFGTFIEQPSKKLPAKYNLSQNYPNPFNPATTIHYSIPRAGNIVLTIHNVLGQKVETLIDKYQKAGYYKVTFDATSLASGLYLYKLEVAGFTETKKCLYIK